MLIDNVTVTIKAGKGGNGSASLRRNAQTAKGGPDGGNGGKGGDVYFSGNDDISLLRQFQYKKHMEAEPGEDGARQNMYGHGGKDLYIKVPFGTIVTDLVSQKKYTITRVVPEILIAHGGKGGRGNNEFKSATNQTPRFAEKGDPGEEKQIHMELRLIADIGLIGLPNAGKSSLLAMLTNANPKIGAYPFTTLEPHLGVLFVPKSDEAGIKSIILADIPGLIEGASTGKGLGIKFLKHVERTRFLIHCISLESEHPVGDYKTIREELIQYNPALGEKKEIILLTKTDITTDEKIAKTKKLFEQFDKPVTTVSVYNDEQLHQLITFITQQLTPKDN